MYEKPNKKHEKFLAPVSTTTTPPPDVSRETSEPPRRPTMADLEEYARQHPAGPVVPTHVVRAPTGEFVVEAG